MNSAMIAVAGAGKTEWITSSALREKNPSRTLVLTFTTTNQHEDALRMVMKSHPGENIPKVVGWRAFVMNEIVKPYLPKRYPAVHMSGLSLKDPNSFQYLSGQSRHFTSSGKAYPSLLGKLAYDVNKDSNGRAIKRIENLYDTIYIDEGQDLRGNDLCVLEELLKSSIDVHIVLDPRQSTLSTAPRDRKYVKDYSSASIIELYRKWHKQGLIDLDYLSETKRFTDQIARFSDCVFDLGLNPTISNVPIRGRHDGVFLIEKSRVKEYSESYQATALAVQKSQDIDAYESVNFGLSKGMTRDDIVILATGPIEKFLETGTRLPPKSACGFYVAITRAKYSVAIAVTNPKITLNSMRLNSIWDNIRLEALT